MEGVEIDNTLASLVTHSLKINERKRRVSSRFRGMRYAKYNFDDDSDERGSPSQDGIRKSARKRIRPLETEKRRVYTKPKKLVSSDNLKDVHNYYLDKKVKRLPPTLETIFEEPQDSKDDLILMSSRKFKRCITFSDVDNVNKLKTKKRLMKAKKMSSNQRKNNKRVTMDFLMEKLKGISDNEEENTDV